MDMDKERVGFHNKYCVELASRSDIEKIVDLTIAAPEYRNVYDRNSLAKQLYDRYDTNFSRFYIVKMDGKVVASTGTKGVVPGFAIVGGLIVSPEYRGLGIASDIEEYVCYKLNQEGTSCIAFVSSNSIISYSLHKKNWRKKYWQNL